MSQERHQISNFFNKKEFKIVFQEFCTFGQLDIQLVLNFHFFKLFSAGYVQGINDLVTPFLTVFLSDYIDSDDVLNYNVSKLNDEKFKEMEADTFWCFSLFVDFNQDMYTFAQPGVQRMVQKLEEIIEKIDPELHDHIVKKQKCDFIQFSFRWMNCLLMREIPLTLIIRIFDTYLSEGDSFATLHSFICACFLKTWSPKLKTLEFGEMIMFIQNLPTNEWTLNEIETLLSQAYMLQCLYK
jgi:TBC1 domain family member 2